MAGPPSTLTKAFPIPLPRAPIHLTEVPVKVNETVAPATVDSTAVPPLHPAMELRKSRCVHPAVMLTVASDSSKRTVAGGSVVPPPEGVPPLEGLPVVGGLAAGELSPLGVPGLPAVGVPGLPPVVVVEVLPPLELSSPPPPPHEISIPASSKKLTRVKQRFIDTLSVRIERSVWDTNVSSSRGDNDPDESDYRGGSVISVFSCPFRH